MEEYRVESFIQLHETIKRHHSEWWCWFYRGHSRAEYKLVPKAGRELFRGRVVGDQRMFESWKLHAVAFLPSTKRELTEWDRLAIAQHHGLSTSLLDWTFNPLNAAFFAIVGSDNRIDDKTDAAIFAHYSQHAIASTDSGPWKGVDPFQCKGIHRVAPSSVIPRIGRQGGIFTLHDPPSLSLEENLPDGDRLEKILIPGKCKRELAIELSHYGVNRMSLFPDLDGLSDHINWSFTHLPYSKREATRQFYVIHAERYASETQGYALQDLWNTFTRVLPKNSYVLDLGCGAGRDLKELAARGYRMLGVDYSEPLAEKARQFSGQEVQVAPFEAATYREATFDGIWAVASLLHIPKSDVSEILSKLHSWLRPDGILLTSMQQGEGNEFSADGRLFELYSPEEWETLLRTAGFEIMERQETKLQVGEPSTGQREMTWFVTICKRVPLAQ